MNQKDIVKVSRHSLEAGLGQAIRATLICTSEGSISVSSQVPESLKLVETPESKMARMKKKISSPLLKRKVNEPSKTNKVFGVHLETILSREPEGVRVPCVVTKIVEYISKNGMHLEGIFRVSGNRRVVENLKAAFDQDGDANLDDSGDIIAVAELLKLYLRELPEPCIPKTLTPEFIRIHKEYGEDINCRQELKMLLEKLPDANYDLVKYLCKFLVSVSKKEGNKMSPMALAIVFGPNVFRCSDGLEGLKEQGYTNAVLCKFLQQYDYLFKDDEGVSPYAATTLFIEEAERNSSFSLSGEGRLVQQKAVQDSSTSEEDIPKFATASSVGNPLERSAEAIYAIVEKPKPKPRLLLPAAVSSCSSTEELDTYVRSVSPSSVLHGNSHSSGVHGIGTHAGKDALQNVIKLSVKEHLFGPEHVSTDETSQESDLSRIHSPESGDEDQTPALPERRYGPEESTPRKRRRKKNSKNQLIEEVFEDEKSVKDKQVAWTNRDEDLDNPGTLQRPAKRKTRQKCSEKQDKDRIIVGVDQNGNDVFSKPVLHRKEIQQMKDITLASQGKDEFAFIPRQSELLKSLTLSRAPPPKNRRRPSFNKLHSTLVQFELDTKQNTKHGEHRHSKHDEACKTFVHPLVEEAKARDVISSPPPRSPRSPKVKQSPPLSPVKKETTIDEVDSGLRPKSRDAQKQKKRIRGIVPPLELYKLNDDGGSHDIQVSPRDRYEGLAVEEARLSPRSRPLTVDTRSYMYPTECPPSPPFEQLDHGWFERRMDASPKGEVSVKQLTKTISQLKKKIREFEDAFEEEHGRKPSHSEKAPVKKHITDLSHARKQLKEIKEKAKGEAERLNETVPAPSKTSETVLESLLTTTPCSVQQSLDNIIRKLEEKRSVADRPLDVEEMSREQIQDEKLAIQKALLQHESVFGRPISKKDKDVMRPLYDRYRLVKRTIAKPRPDKENFMRNSPGTKLERKSRSMEKLADLEPIHEDSLLHGSSVEDNGLRIRAATHPNSLSKDSPVATCSMATPLQVDTVMDSEDPSEHSHLSETLNFDDTFAVTKINQEFQEKSGNVKLHEMSEYDLQLELESATKDKKKLRKKLKKFEDDFVDRTGRKVQKEDRGDMEEEYSKYKQIKAKLRLLEALLNKRQASRTV